MITSKLERIVRHFRRNIVDPDKDLIRQRYSMAGKVRVEFSIADDSCTVAQEEIRTLYNSEQFSSYCRMVEYGATNYYGRTDEWLYNALRRYPIAGNRLLIFGSTAPWYEAVGTVYGASEIAVLEYGQRESVAENVRYYLPSNPPSGQFDRIFSISSFEHDGLGRYGDPLNVDGDLVAMESCRSFLKKEGLLYLAIPVGRDRVYFNMHRVYGQTRLPILLRGWEVLDIIGRRPFMYHSRANGSRGTPYQPIFVLRQL